MVVSSRCGKRVIVRERHRWQPEEDALLRAYVRRYGAKDWGLLPQRMGRGFLHPRDPKSCQDRWKNYLRPGLKKGSLTPDEQALLVSLQAKLGNRWKLIAAQLPGRTPKRLGKWWDAFKDRQHKLLLHRQQQLLLRSRQLPQQVIAAHLLPPSLLPPSSLLLMSRRIIPPNLSLSASGTGEATGVAAVPSTPTLSLATQTTAVGLEASAALPSAAPPKYPHRQQKLQNHHHLPPWMSASPTGPACATGAASCSPSVSLSLSSSSAAPRSPSDAAAAGKLGSFLPLHQAAALAQLCMDLDEGRQAWAHHRKEAAWRLSRLEQQLETEKARKRKEVTDDVEANIRCLREEEAACLDRLEAEYREQLGAIQRDAEAKEAKMAEPWAARHTKLARLAEQVAGASAAAAGSHHFAVSKDLH